MNQLNIFHQFITHPWWRHQMETFPRYWPFDIRGIHQSPVNSPHKGHWRGALIFSLICAWINGWVNNREAADARRHRAHYDVIVMVGGFRLTSTAYRSQCYRCVKVIRAFNTQSRSFDILKRGYCLMHWGPWYVFKHTSQSIRRVMIQTLLVDSLSFCTELDKTFNHLAN